MRQVKYRESDDRIDLNGLFLDFGCFVALVLPYNARPERHALAASASGLGWHILPAL